MGRLHGSHHYGFHIRMNGPWPVPSLFRFPETSRFEGKQGQRVFTYLKQNRCVPIYKYFTKTIPLIRVSSYGELGLPAN